MTITNGSYLVVDLKVPLSEIPDIFNMGLLTMPLYWDYKMIKKAYDNNPSKNREKLKPLLNIIESGDKNNVIVKFKTF